MKKKVMFKNIIAGSDKSKTHDFPGPYEFSRTFQV